MFPCFVPDVSNWLYISSVILKVKYLNVNIDKSGWHYKRLCDHSMKGFCVDKFYVWNGIFKEIGLVLITDFFPFEDFFNSSKLRIYPCKVFTVLYRDFVSVNQTLKLKRNA